MMSLGPTSELALTNYRSIRTTQEGIFNTQLNRGTLAVKSGQIVKQTPEAMHISTPAALLGVRGTEFVVTRGKADAHGCAAGGGAFLSACAPMKWS